MINKRLKDALFTDQWSELFMETLGPFGYVLVASQRMQGVLLLAFSKFSHLPFLRDVQTEKTRTGLGGCWGNKGGVSTRMTMFGHPVCFLNCHLPAHMRNLDQRMEDFESILQQQQFEGGTATGVLDHDVVFWFGDLNFRIEDYDIHVVKCAVDSHKLPLLWERDQLNMAKNTALILDGFTEGPLNFPPTYKFDVGTHTYDTSAKKRKPAWTDRILWRLRRTGSSVPNHSAALRRGLTSWLGGTTKVTQHEYRSHMDYTVSDHKPVSAIFSLHFPFKVDIPLVQLQVEKEWCSVSDATVRFSVASSYQRSSWDWVALYKVGFRHHKDYVAFIWAKGEHVAQPQPRRPLQPAALPPGPEPLSEAQRPPERQPLAGLRRQEGAAGLPGHAALALPQPPQPPEPHQPQEPWRHGDRARGLGGGHPGGAPAWSGLQPSGGGRQADRETHTR
uniref:Inositol polyphosphate-5-phosphatase Ja n=1 Tax=Gadus morhua TaxID=8049 RepID=A0A8C5CFG8_GADMO